MSAKAVGSVRSTQGIAPPAPSLLHSHIHGHAQPPCTPHHTNYCTTPRHATHPRQVNLEAQERALFEPRAVPAWFSCDVRLGQVTITLEPPGCFAAEEYAQVRA